MPDMQRHLDTLGLGALAYVYRLRISVDQWYPGPPRVPSIAPDFFRSLTWVYELNLYGTQLTALPGLVNIGRVDKLYVSFVGFQNMASLSGLRCLRAFHIDFNAEMSSLDGLQNARPPTGGPDLSAGSDCLGSFESYNYSPLNASIAALRGWAGCASDSTSLWTDFQPCFMNGECYITEWNALCNFIDTGSCGA
eukprot:jgi/Botrbrau1/21685/Bobra.43_1s0081.1